MSHFFLKFYVKFYLFNTIQKLNQMHCKSNKISSDAQKKVGSLSNFKYLRERDI